MCDSQGPPSTPERIMPTKLLVLLGILGLNLLLNFYNATQVGGIAWAPVVVGALMIVGIAKGSARGDRAAGGAELWRAGVGRRKRHRGRRKWLRHLVPDTPGCAELDAQVFAGRVTDRERRPPLYSSRERVEQVGTQCTLREHEAGSRQLQGVVSGGGHGLNLDEGFTTFAVGVGRTPGSTA